MCPQEIHEMYVVNFNELLLPCPLSKVCFEDRCAYMVRDKTIFKQAWIVGAEIISGVVASPSPACEEKKQRCC